MHSPDAAEQLDDSHFTAAMNEFALFERRQPTKYRSDRVRAVAYFVLARARIASFTAVRDNVTDNVDNSEKKYSAR